MTQEAEKEVRETLKSIALDIGWFSEEEEKVVVEALTKYYLGKESVSTA